MTPAVLDAVLRGDVRDPGPDAKLVEGTSPVPAFVPQDGQIFRDERGNLYRLRIHSNRRRTLERVAPKLRGKAARRQDKRDRRLERERIARQGWPTTVAIVDEVTAHPRAVPEASL